MALGGQATLLINVYFYCSCRITFINQSWRFWANLHGEGMGTLRVSWKFLRSPKLFRCFAKVYVLAMPNVITETNQENNAFF